MREDDMFGQVGPACTECADLWIRLGNQLITSGLSYRFLAEVSDDRRDPLLSRVAGKLKEFSQSLEAAASHLITYMVERGGEYRYRDSRQPSWSGMPQGIGAVVGVHRYTKSLVTELAKCLSVHRHLEERAFLRAVLSDHQVESMWVDVKNLLESSVSSTASASSQLFRDRDPDAASSSYRAESHKFRPKATSTEHAEEMKENTREKEEKEEEEEGEEYTFRPVFTSSTVKRNSRDDRDNRDTGVSRDASDAMDNRDTVVSRDEEEHHTLEMLRERPQQPGTSFRLEEDQLERRMEAAATNISPPDEERPERMKEAGVYTTTTTSWQETVGDEATRPGPSGLDTLKGRRTENARRQAEDTFGCSQSGSQEETGQEEDAEKGRKRLAGRTVLLVERKFSKAVSSASSQLSAWLKGEGATVLSTSQDSLLPADLSANGLHLVICLGGDGTVLEASNLFAESLPPFLAFSMGHTNFLSSLPWDFHAARMAVERILVDQEFRLLNRSRLSLTLHNPGQKVARLTALNEVTVRRMGARNMADLNIHLNGHLLYTARGDGVLVSTATGSSAYSMSAGGPLLHPTLPCLLLTPLYSFPPIIRPVVLPADSHLTISLSPDSRQESLPMGVDCRSDLMLLLGGHLDIRMSEHVLPQVESVEKNSLSGYEDSQTWIDKIRSIFKS